MSDNKQTYTDAALDGGARGVAVALEPIKKVASTIGHDAKVIASKDATAGAKAEAAGEILAATALAPLAAVAAVLSPAAANIGAAIEVGKKLAGRRTAQEEEVAAVFEDKKGPKA